MSERSDDTLLGKSAPSFCLPDAEGKQCCLSDLSGRWVVLYFYPRDNTPGCTLEARGFSDGVDEFAGLGAVIIGVSADTIDSHRKFAEKQNLRFRILSDADHTVLRLYGVWKDVPLISSIAGIERSTFLIDPVGNIAAIWRKVKVFGHVEEVKQRLRELSDRS